MKLYIFMIFFIIASNQVVQEKFEKEFQIIKNSSFVTYKNPSTLHENIINCIRVRDRVLQKDSRHDYANNEYKDLRRHSFPFNKITEMVEAALKNMSNIQPQKQMKLTSFFKYEPKPR